MYLLIILNIYLSLFSFSFAANITITKEQIEAIDKWTKLGVDAVNAARSDDVQLIIKVTESLGSVIPYIGPIATVVSGLLQMFGGPDATTQALNEIKDKLNIMNTKLFAIDRKLDNVVDIVKDEIIINAYKTHIENLNYLQSMYERYVSNPTVTTKSDLVANCRTHDMMNLIDWLHREVVSETIQPITRILEREYDLKKFIIWSKTITSSFTAAAYLHGICVVSNNSNTTDITKTLSGDSDIFRKKSFEISNKFKSESNKIKTEFWSNAKNEINNFMAENTKMENDIFAHELYNKMKNKYYFRNWYVGSYSGSTSTSVQHASLTDENTSHHWIREHERCLFVGSTSDQSTNVETEFNNCYNKKLKDNSIGSDSSDSIAKAIYSCLTPHAVLAVRFGNGFRGYGDNGRGMSSVNINYKDHSYSIVIIK